VIGTLFFSASRTPWQIKASQIGLALCSAPVSVMSSGLR
jgi:hypothetical protein